MKCDFCHSALTTGDTDGACSSCKNKLAYQQRQILDRAIFKTPELKTWQCPFCKMVYNENVPSCGCQTIKEKTD